ncbi:MAG: hypothetical protein ACR2OA_18795 [Rubripirellula sp.]
MTKLLTVSLLKQLITDAEPDAYFDTSEYTDISDDAAAQLVSLTLQTDRPQLDKTHSRRPSRDETRDARWILDLDGLTSLSDGAAQHFRNFEGSIYLNGLTDLTDTALASLCENASELSLNSLNSLGHSTAQQLAQFRGSNLYLDGLTSISTSAAKTLFSLQACDQSFELSLNGMQTIDEEVAFELRNFKGQSLALDGLEHLTTEVAESLSLIKPTRGRLDVSLNRLTSISGEASAYISRITGDLSLNGLHSISFAVAESLGKFRGMNLWLDGVQELSPDAAANLSRIEGADLFSSHSFLGLFLNGLTHLPDESAANLAQINSGLWLNGLQEISDTVAEYLSQTTEELWLTGLKHLSDQAAASLSKKPQELHLDGLEGLSTNAAEHFSNFEGVLYLNGLKRISSSALRALCDTQADLALDGLTNLSAADAQSLSRHRGNWLSLNGITKLHAEAADYLSFHQGEILSLYGVNNVSFIAAATMLRYRGKVLVINLDNIQDDASKILRKHPGIIHLAG